MKAATENDSRIRIEIKGKLGNFISCLSCGEVTPAHINNTDLHNKGCHWRYHVECRRCNYQNSVAKLLHRNCTCEVKKF